MFEMMKLMMLCGTGIVIAFVVLLAMPKSELRSVLMPIELVTPLENPLVATHIGHSWRATTPCGGHQECGHLVVFCGVPGGLTLGESRSIETASRSRNVRTFH